jgi:cytochrome oxidase Cu insertion factor (SCO1/SenC/PrrC family)
MFSFRRHPADAFSSLALFVYLNVAGCFLHSADAAPDTATARARDYFTDTLVVDQSGRSQRFFSDLLAGRTVLINYIFTRCTDACPLITHKLNQVRERLGGKLPGEVRFISISVDPGHDTAARLGEFAARNRAIDPEWRFVSGSVEDIRLVLSRLGQRQADLLDHSTAMVAANVGRSQWVKIHPDATPEFIVETLDRLQAPLPR